MLEVVKASETSVNFYQSAQRNTPADSHPHTRRHGKLKSQIYNTNTFQKTGYYCTRETSNNSEAFALVVPLDFQFMNAHLQAVLHGHGNT